MRREKERQQEKNTSPEKKEKTKQYQNEFTQPEKNFKQEWPLSKLLSTNQKKFDNGKSAVAIVIH